MSAAYPAVADREYAASTSSEPMPEMAPEQTLPLLIRRNLNASQKAEQAFGVLAHRVEELKTELEETNRRLREKVTELDRMSGHLHSLLNGISDGVIAVDLSRRIRLANPAAERMLSRTAESLTGQSISELFGANAEIEHLLDRALDGSLETGRASVNLPDCGPFAAAAVSPVRDPSGAVLGAVIALQDLAEIDRMQKRLQQADRLAALGQMAAVLAHEIRNPIGGIEGFALLLQEELAEKPAQKRYAEMILTGLKGIHRLADNLLDFTRVPVLMREPVSLQPFFYEIWEAVSADRASGANAIRFEIEAQAGGVAVAGDRAALRQVFLNLIRNACEAMTPKGGGSIKVRVERLPGSGQAAIELSDSGPGLPEAVRGQLFQPFVTTKRNGNGLGLSAVAKIVGAHGGEITYRNEPGGGACFRILLPLSASN